MITFKQARQIHLTDLASMGWTLSDPTLKVPYATSPDGKYRLWYKAQAVHVTYTKHAFKDARAVCQFGIDIRFRFSLTGGSGYRLIWFQRTNIKF